MTQSTITALRHAAEAHGDSATGDLLREAANALTGQLEAIKLAYGILWGDSRPNPVSRQARRTLLAALTHAQRGEGITLAREMMMPSTKAVGEDADSYEHLANEWADMATNGIQWLRNVRDGISTPSDALAEMNSNHMRICRLRDGEKS